MKAPAGGCSLPRIPRPQSQGYRENPCFHRREPVGSVPAPRAAHRLGLRGQRPDGVVVQTGALLAGLPTVLLATVAALVLVTVGAVSARARQPAACRALPSISVAGPDLTADDAYAGLAANDEHPRWLDRLPGYDAVTVPADPDPWSPQRCAGLRVPRSRGRPRPPCGDRLL